MLDTRQQVDHWDWLGSSEHPRIRADSQPATDHHHPNPMVWGGPVEQVVYPSTTVYGWRNIGRQNLPRWGGVGKLRGCKKFSGKGKNG